jgi:hypothetical protein
LPLRIYSVRNEMAGKVLQCCALQRALARNEVRDQWGKFKRS